MDKRLLQRYIFFLNCERIGKTRGKDEDNLIEFIELLR